MAFADDEETPAKMKQDLRKIIDTWEVRLGAQQSSNVGAEESLASRSSRLSSFLHAYWHDIAKKQLKTRYGLVKDNPAHVVRAKEAIAKRKKKT
jgi:hypothetical protein